MIARYAYKLLTPDDWTRAQALGHTDSAVDRADGYVHLSTADQADETARRYFAGEAGIVLLEFDLEALDADIRWEPSRGGALFPHIYGDLEIVNATRRWTLDQSPDGAPILPKDLKS